MSNSKTKKQPLCMNCQHCGSVLPEEGEVQCIKTLNAVDGEPGAWVSPRSLCEHYQQFGQEAA